MKLTWIMLAALMLAPACSGRHLYVAHDTVIGVNARLNQGRNEGQLVMGYDRDFVTIIPRSVEVAPEDPDKTPPPQPALDVMSLVSCTILQVDGPSLTRYEDVIVSGDAAATYAQSGKATGEVFNCNFGKETNGG